MNIYIFFEKQVLSDHFPAMVPRQIFGRAPKYKVQLYALGFKVRTKSYYFKESMIIIALEENVISLIISTSIQHLTIMIELGNKYSFRKKKSEIKKNQAGTIVRTICPWSDFNMLTVSCLVKPSRELPFT